MCKHPMPRTKKQIKNNFVEDSHLNLVEPVEIVTNEWLESDEPDPIAEETHRVVTTWKKKVPVGSTNNVEVIEVAPEPAAPRPPDPIEELLREIGVSPQQWSMTVQRLPNYERDGNCSPTAKKIICATLPFDANYAETIQARFARPNKPNDFLVAVRCGNRIHSYLPVVQVEYLAPDNATADPAQAIYAVPAAVEARDAFAELEKALRMVKRMNDALGVSQTLQPPPPEPPKLTTEAALMHLANEDPEQIARMRDRIFGRDNPTSEPESAWAPFVKELLPTVPVLAQGLLMWLGGQAQANPAALESPGQITSPPVIPPAEPPPPQPTAEQHVLSNILTALSQNAQTQEIAALLAHMEMREPAIKPLISFLTDQEPAEVLEYLRQLVPLAAEITQRDYAENWVKSVQQHFFDDTPQEPAA